MTMRLSWAVLVPLLAMLHGVAAQEPPLADAEPLPVIPLAAEPEAPLPDEDAVELEPITTVGTRTPRHPLEVPASISIVTAAEIEARQLSDLGEALGGLAGVNITGGPRLNAESINIRGLSGTRVLLSVDGARQNFDGAHRSRLHVDPELLKSVDLLRGPASALWGSDALGGVVAVETKDAADLLRDGERFGLRLRTGFENASAEQLAGATAFGRFGELDWVAHAASRDSGAIQQGGGERIPHSALDTGSGLYKATWAPAAGQTLGVSLQRYQQRGESPSNPAQEVDTDNPLLARANDQDYLSARYGYAGEGRVEAAHVTAYRTSLAIVEDRVDEYRHDTLDFATEGFSAHGSLRFAPLAQRLTAGVEGYRDGSQATRNGAPRAQFPDAQREVLGVFVQDEIGLGHGWSVIPGLRYDSVRATSNTGAADETQQDRVSSKLAAAYDLTDWLSVHAGYAQAFRAPSLLETYAAGTHFLGNEFRPNPGLRPERAANVEAGVRLLWNELLAGDDSLRFKASAYGNDIDDYIETVVVVETQGPFPPPAQCTSPTPAEGCVNRNDDGTANPAIPPVFVGGYTTSVNLRNARIHGVELEGRYDLGPFSFGANYSRVRGEDTGNGMPLLTIPADAVHGTASVGSRGLRLGARVTHASAQDRVPVDAEGNPLIPPTSGYTVTDLFVSWEPSGATLRGLKLDVGVDNVTDRLYRNHLAPLAEAGINPRAALSYQF